MRDHFVKPDRDLLLVVDETTGASDNEYEFARPSDGVPPATSPVTNPPSSCAVAYFASA
jgi:hypothetical protein